MKLVVAVTVLIGASAWAQDAPPAPQGSDASAGQQPASDYGGPSVLSRGGEPSVLLGGAGVRLRPFIAVTGSYDSGYVQTSNGYVDRYGVSGSFGVVGKHVWEHSVLDLDYHGAYRNYANYSYNEGMDNTLLLNFQHQLTPRLGVTLSESASRVHSVFGLPIGSNYGGGFSSYNPLQSALASNSLLDTPSTASVSTVRLVYQWTRRWSVSVGGTGILSRQRAQELLGVNGEVASADIAYRLSRYQTISFNYSFSHFGYKGQLGGSDIHGAGASYSARLGRYWEAGVGAGISRVESLRGVPVQLDPVLAALLGVSVVFQKVHTVIYSPYAGAHLTRSFRRSSWSAGYERSVTPGNGLFTTSTYETANTSYTYNASRRLTLQAGAAYSRFSAVMQSLGRYRSYSAGGGFNVRVARGFSLVGRADVRRYSVADTLLDRTQNTASVGFSWNPGEYPLALW